MQHQRWQNQTVSFPNSTLLFLNRFYGVVVSTLDFESKDPSSNLGRTCLFFYVSSWKRNWSFNRSGIVWNVMQHQKWKNQTFSFLNRIFLFLTRFCGVVVSTLDFESKDPSSNLGRTWFCFLMLALGNEVEVSTGMVLFVT